MSFLTLIAVIVSIIFCVREMKRAEAEREFNNTIIDKPPQDNWNNPVVFTENSNQPTLMSYTSPSSTMQSTIVSRTNNEI